MRGPIGKRIAAFLTATVAPVSLPIEKRELLPVVVGVVAVAVEAGAVAVRLLLRSIRKLVNGLFSAMVNGCRHSERQRPSASARLRC